MTLQANGTISLSQVAAELGITSPTNMHLGDPRVRQLSFQYGNYEFLGLCRGKSALDMLTNPFPAIIRTSGGAPNDGSVAGIRISIFPGGGITFFPLGAATLSTAATFSSSNLQLPNQILQTIDTTNSGRGWWWRVNGTAQDAQYSAQPATNGVWYPLLNDAHGGIFLEARGSDPAGAIAQGSVDFARSSGGAVVQSLNYEIIVLRF